ncbi:hypothetical protein J19TS1_12140 [Heyndrickxia oleronia]|nr:hypothetical protein J19TS1_12140 [Heyndrickxia oleronia]
MHSLFLLSFHEKNYRFNLNLGINNLCKKSLLLMNIKESSHGKIETNTKKK